MLLYAEIASERASRPARKGGDEYLEIDLSAFGKKVGELLLQVMTDQTGAVNQYLLSYRLTARDEWQIIQEGHKAEGIVQYNL